MQDGVVEEGRGHQRGGGGQLGLRAVESLPLALGLGHRPLLQLRQAAALLLDHLLAWGEVGGGADQRGSVKAGTSDSPQTSLIWFPRRSILPTDRTRGHAPPLRWERSPMINGRREDANDSQVMKGKPWPGEGEGL